jgi:hypothetical protein
MTMARVGRLAGAILAETEGGYFLVGNTKRPCDWRAAGFEPPGDLDATARPFVRLARAPAAPAVEVAGPWLEVPVEGEELARGLAARLLIDRNGSVSDRLWRLVLRGDPDAEDPPRDAVVDARWLYEVPAPIWDIVRAQVLRCL